MKTSITIFTYENEDSLDDINKASFMAQDIASTLHVLNLPATIIMIHYFEASQEEKEKAIKNTLDVILKDCNFKLPPVICINSYISAEEFPPEKYYLNEYAKEEGKIQLPVDEILNREDELITKLGFININDYVKYQYQTAYIYPTEIGKKVRAHFDELLKE